jgi:hypothetical protein
MDLHHDQACILWKLAARLVSFPPNILSRHRQVSAANRVPPVRRQWMSGP